MKAPTCRISWRLFSTWRGRGALEIEETQEPGFLGIGTTSDFVYRRKSGFAGTLRPYEDTLLDNMFKSGKKVQLSDLKNKFYTAVPTIRKQLYEAVVNEGYLASNPETVRTTYGCLGAIALVAAVISGFFVAAALTQFSSVRAVRAARVDRDSHRRDYPGPLYAAANKTGSEAVARWRAFKRYLQNLEKYTKVEEATEIFERYLPYAVAFGLEQSFIRKFEKVDAPPPTWWIPYGMPRPYYGGGGSAGGGHVPGHAAPMSSEGGSAPSLDGMSREHGQFARWHERRPGHDAVAGLEHVDQRALFQRKWRRRRLLGRRASQAAVAVGRRWWRRREQLWLISTIVR